MTKKGTSSLKLAPADTLIRREGAWGELAGLRPGDLVEYRLNEECSEPLGQGRVKARTDSCVMVTVRDGYGSPNCASLLPHNLRRVFFDLQDGDDGAPS